MLKLSSKIIWLSLICLLTSISGFIAVKYRQTLPNLNDSIGYMYASQQLAQEKGLAYLDDNNQMGHQYYTLHTFKIFRDNSPHRFLDYPPGLPVVAAFYIRLTQNPDILFLLVPFMASLVLLVTCLLTMATATSEAGFWAGIILFSLPIFVSFSTVLLSEIPSTAFLYAGIGCYLGASYKIKRPVVAFSASMATGCLIGATFFMRFSNLSLLPAVVALCYFHRTFPNALYRHVGVAAGTAVALCGILYFNTYYYGGPFTTGYTPQHGWYIEPPFALQYALGKSFVDGYSLYALGKTLWHNFNFLLLFCLIPYPYKKLSINWYILAFCVLLPYGFYAFSASGINSRFIIPAVPALTILIGTNVTTIFQRISLVLNSNFHWVSGLLKALFMLYLLWPLPAQITTLAERNNNDTNYVSWIDNVVADTPVDAIFLSYVHNDAIAIYGKRSVLNYRHLVPYDSTTNKYRYDLVEKLLVSEIEALFKKNKPVYYMLDKEPSLYNSYEILAKHFHLKLLKEQYQLYQVTRK